MKIDKEINVQDLSGKRSKFGLVLFFSVIIIGLVSGYYFFALYLKKIDFDYQNLKQSLSLVEIDLKENKDKIKDLFFNYEILSKRQVEKGDSTNFLNLVKLVESSLLVRNFNSCFFILNLIKEDLEKGTFIIARDALNQDIEQIMTFQANPYFKIGERLNNLAKELNNVPDILEANFKSEKNSESMKEVVNVSIWKKILTALKNLIVVERMKTTSIMPSERKILILEMRLLINDARMAWLADDVGKYRIGLSNFRACLLKVCDVEEISWGQKIFREINELMKIDVPEIPRLKIKQILMHEEV